ncbi:MAG: site-specific DNA-methyltransferase, partial [Nitriliruptor sp.]|uniref:site-specific DNA-methyltransferase n=1 Tax=Nitriliruptor sp. TaxID=2448056 RepID=UPI0034A0A46C
DDTEVHRARCVMDEVFGPASYLGTVVWEKDQGRRNDAHLSDAQDFLLVFGRSDRKTWKASRNLLPRTAAQDGRYRNPDDDPRGPWLQGDNGTAKSGGEKYRFPVTLPSGRVVRPPEGNYWRFTEASLEAARTEGRVHFGQNGDSLPVVKRYLSDVQGGLVPRTLWMAEEVGSNMHAKRDHLRKMFPEIEPFGTPKPEGLLERVIHIGSNPGDIVLDCFGGSGTTAAVALKMGRRFVTVEREPDTVATFLVPRLTKVVEGEDPGGVTEQHAWQGGGGFRVLDVAPSMFDEADDGEVELADWATNGALAEAVAAQLGIAHEPDGPFAGTRGRTHLAVVDGLVNRPVLEALVARLPADGSLLVAGTAVASDAERDCRSLVRGGQVRKIPAAILTRYRREVRR